MLERPKRTLSGAELRRTVGSQEFGSSQILSSPDTERAASHEDRPFVQALAPISGAAALENAHAVVKVAAARTKEKPISLVDVPLQMVTASAVIVYGCSFRADFESIGEMVASI
jgi:hypothetical protein